MTKYIFAKNKLTVTPYCHAYGIETKEYDIAVRLIIFEKERIIYIRINEFNKLYIGLKYRKVEYQFNKNLQNCETYLERNYKRYKVYNSYSINELPDQIQRDILNS